MRPFVRYWIPVILWASFVLLASSDAFAANHTGSTLAAILHAILGHDLPREYFDALHFVIRKAAHLTEYGILSALALRALRQGEPWSMRRAIGAVALAAVVASVDEAHQSTLPSRTGTPVDVGIDVTGASIAAALPALARRRSTTS